MPQDDGYLVNADAAHRGAIRADPPEDRAAGAAAASPEAAILERVLMSFYVLFFSFLIVWKSYLDDQWRR